MYKKKPPQKLKRFRNTLKIHYSVMVTLVPIVCAFICGA